MSTDVRSDGETLGDSTGTDRRRWRFRTALAVARKDLADVARSRMLLTMVALLVGFVAILYAAFGFVADDGTALETLAWLGMPMQTVLGVAALVVGYMAIVGERRSGSIKLLLGLPPSRRDVLLGTLASRSAIVLLAVVPAALLAAGLSLAVFGTLPVAEWLVLSLATALFGLAFVGLAVGVSASVSTRGRAMALTVGLFTVFVALWELVVAGPYYLIHGKSPPIEAEAWYLFLDGLNPIAAYAGLANAAIPGDVWPLQFGYGLREPAALTMTAAERYPGDAPVYLEAWFGAVVLLAWFLIPLAIGYRRFRRTDL
ncbi:ABC transporter permease subunit [Halovivax cerinus]|uniref:ABC transporter permease subunit n=1 Tax=Halovivax cerinus TaxID=1487865 RepID=A0ABD5NK24_9EURY|nr:ABC transporter permease subunit [Halovivax cerinus]